MGFLRLSWESSGAQKPLKTARFLKVFANTAFWVFEAPDGPLGAHLGAFLGRSGPKMVPKMAPKLVQKVSKNWSKK